MKKIIKTVVLLSMMITGAQAISISELEFGSVYQKELEPITGESANASYGAMITATFKEVPLIGDATVTATALKESIDIDFGKKFYFDKQKKFYGYLGTGAKVLYKEPTVLSAYNNQINPYVKGELGYKVKKNLTVFGGVKYFFEKQSRAKEQYIPYIGLKYKF
jgi:hypothetical protein